jgi:cell wall-associated NlpC family hydrolase
MRRSQVTRALRPLIVAAVAVAIVAPVFAGDASAQDVGSQQARVNQLASELTSLQNRAGVLDEQYLETAQRLQQVQTQLDQNKAEVDDAQARMDKARNEASSYVVSAYMGAGAGLDVAPGTGDPNQAVNQQVLLETLQGDRQQVADDLRAAKLDLADKQSDLESSTKQLADAQSKQKSLKDDLQASVAKQQSLLAGANAQLQAAVQAEQARRAAAAQAAAEAKAQAQAAADAAAEQAAASSSTTSTSTKAASASAKAGTSVKGTSTTTKPVAPKKSGSAGKPAAPVITGPISAPNGGAGAAIAAARSVLGVPYRWAGASPSGFDCSGLVMWSYAHAGVGLPHSSSGQYAATQRIPVSALQPGDLVFYGSPVHHVGIYIGGGSMIHAPHTGDVVRVASIYSMGETPMGGRIR